MASGEWPADFGPQVPHPRAGVVLVGARQPLVAFNALLHGASLATARAIAAALREGGPRGLPGLRALGLELTSRRGIQISMNVTAPEQTPLASVLRGVEEEAARHGARVIATELVGLAPRIAIGECTAGDLKLPALGPQQVVESYLEDG
jgi:glutamate formiminotransferase